MTIRKLILTLWVILTISLEVSRASEAADGVSNFKNIKAPGAIETDTNAVNDSGFIAGDYVDNNGVQHAMILKGTKLTSVDRKNCTTKAGLSGIAFYGINNKENAVGWCMDAVTGASDAFSYLKGKKTKIAPPGATSTEAQGINDKGAIVGTYLDSGGAEHGFLLSGGKYTTLDVPGGYTNSDAWSINNSGLITIFAANSSGTYDSFLFDGKTYTNIDVPGAADSFVATINSFGDRVYTILDSENNIFGAFFLNVNGGSYFVFSDPKGGSNTQAFGLNDKLKIIGSYAPTGRGRPSNPSFQGYSAIGCCRGISPNTKQSH